MERISTLTPPDDFITLYTDASVRSQIKRTQIAWRGRCRYGVIQGYKVLPYDSRVARAEMSAILHAIEDALAKYPQLSGVFVNSDNLQCVQSFWTFLKKPVHKDIHDLHASVLKLVDHRWLRTKHVKAHTGGADIRSYMNRTVDRMTRELTENDL